MATTTTDPVKPGASRDRPDSGTALGHPAAGPDETAAAGLRLVDEKAAHGRQTPPQSATGDPASSLSEQKDTLEAEHKNKADPPGGFDSTPIPDAPQGYTIKFTFHNAKNLPVADFGTGSSDPFLTATLTTALRKRHKEDPDLFFRTRTIRKSLEPEWEQEWIVANVPASGFKLKCRLYDEDWPDSDDRLGNVTLVVDNISESWKGIPQDEFNVKKRSGSKRAYLLSACTSLLVKDHSITPRLTLSAVLLGPSDPPHGHMYTVGPTYYFKHFSPMIGRMMGVKVNRNAEDDHSMNGSQKASSEHNRGRETEKYDFQASTVQLAGPVPPKLYHRFVEFRPVIGKLFKNKGVRGKILNGALHHQHRRLYSFRRDTEFGTFEPCTEEASLQFLRMVHFDQGGRIFTYVITLDGMMRFTETGKEFGIDLLSKHTMHSDAAVYIACSGEFMIRRLKQPDASEDPEPHQPTHPSQDLPDGPPHSPPPVNPRHYQLIIDNESGTYRPDKSVLPELHDFLERNFPGLGIVTLDGQDPELKKLKDEQFQTKKKEGRVVHMVANHNSSTSSFSSDDVSDLDDLGAAGDAGRQSKREKALDVLADPSKLKEYAGMRSGPSEASPPSATEKAGQSSSASAARP